MSKWDPELINALAETSDIQRAAARTHETPQWLAQRILDQTFPEGIKEHAGTEEELAQAFVEVMGKLKAAAESL